MTLPSSDQWRIIGQQVNTLMKGRIDLLAIAPDSNTAWRVALIRAGIEDFRFHDLRHTWASWLIQAGVPLSALQEMGGWESRYAHLAPNHLTEHARKIDSLLGGDDTNTTQEETKWD